MNAQEMVAPVAQDILDAAAETEAERRLPDSLMARLKGQGLFAIYTPREFGGLGLPLPEGLRVVEEVSRYDASTGWTVALGVGNAFFLSALPNEGAREVLDGGSTLISGAPGPGVRAVPVEGGYRLTGQWAFNSGAWNADWMGVAAVVFEGEQPKTGPLGPEMTFAVLRPQDVEVVDTWHVTGLRGTSTHDLRVHNAFVPTERTGKFGFPGGPVPVRETPLTRFGLFPLIGLTQSPPVCLGAARRAIDEFREMAPGKQGVFGGARLSEQVQAQVALARAEALLGSARAYWYDNVDCAWTNAVRGCEISLDQRARMRMASLTAVENSVAAVDSLVRLAGTTAIFQSSAIERCWRDIHTAAQHVQVQDGRWETAGRVLFGMEPASPLI